MTNGELLRQLFRGYVKRDDNLFRQTAESIIEEERAKNHRLLADDLDRILRNGNGHGGLARTPSYAGEVPRDRERGVPLLDVAEFDYEWERLVLPPRSMGLLQQIALEHQRRDVLAAAGLQPKQRLLFYGPPGCGKTLAARVLASALHLPLVLVRFDAIVSSYLGETAANLRRVFEFVERGQWVVLFDEFDAIGKDRDNPSEHGELKRVVNSLLQLMDAFRGESLLIAATNHEALLDSAVWRRMDAIVPFSPPTQQDRELMLRLFLRGFMSSGLNLARVARRTKRATGADLEWLCLEAARHAVLQGRTTVADEDVELAVTSLQERLRIARAVNQTDDGSPGASGASA